MSTHFPSRILVCMTFHFGWKNDRALFLFIMSRHHFLLISEPATSDDQYLPLFQFINFDLEPLPPVVRDLDAASEGACWNGNVSYVQWDHIIMVKGTNCVLVKNSPGHNRSATVTRRTIRDCDWWCFCNCWFSLSVQIST